MPARELEREIVGDQANRLMMLLFLWATDEDEDAIADVYEAEAFSRALRAEDYPEPLSEADAAALGMTDASDA